MINIFTAGTYDIPHAGHFKIFKKCREIAGTGEVVVGINSDEFVMRYRGKPCVMSYAERKKTLLELPWIDRVLPNNQTGGNAQQTILESGCNLIVIGSDWSPWHEKKKDYLQQLGITQKWLDSLGIGLCFLPYTEWISSTEIKARISRSR